MKPEIRIVPQAEVLYSAAADEFVQAAAGAVRKTGSFTVALSRGSTPGRLYSLLAVIRHTARQVRWE